MCIYIYISYICIHNLAVVIWVSPPQSPPAFLIYPRSFGESEHISGVTSCWPAARPKSPGPHERLPRVPQGPVPAELRPIPVRHKSAPLNPQRHEAGTRLQGLREHQVGAVLRVRRVGRV